MRVEIFVQARMGSTRLPGKVMKTVLSKPLLGYLIERLRQVKEADAFAILTTTQPEDDLIVNFCKEQGVLCYRGSEEDVLERYYQVAIERHPDAIVRITADCPLIDPEIVDRVIRKFKDSFPAYDYMSNSLQRTYPIGLDTEIFSLQALIEAFHEGVKNDEREHVTPYIYRHPEHFHLLNIASEKMIPVYRLTVDTPEDFALVKLIIETLYPVKPQFRLDDILELIERHPEWLKLNAHIKHRILP